MVISSGMSAMGDGVLVLLFLLPEAEVVVGRPVLLVATRGVVLAVVLPGPRAPDVDTPEIKADLIKEKKGKRDSSLGPKDVLSADCGGLWGIVGATANARFAAQTPFREKLEHTAREAHRGVMTAGAQPIFQKH